MREHTVELSCGALEELEQCRVRVQAVPVDILLPSALEVRLPCSPCHGAALGTLLPTLSLP